MKYFHSFSEKTDKVERRGRRESFSSTFKAPFGFTLFTAVLGVCGEPHAHREWLKTPVKKTLFTNQREEGNKLHRQRINMQLYLSIEILLSNKYTDVFSHFTEIQHTASQNSDNIDVTTRGGFYSIFVNINTQLIYDLSLKTF